MQMDESTRILILIILVLLLLMTLSFFFSRVLLKRAITRIIRLFRDKQALNAASAKTQEEIGMKKRSLFEFRALRDFTPMALQILIKNNIIQVTEEGKLFLSEETLAMTNLEEAKSSPGKN
jgi:hypothetical protein